MSISSFSPTIIDSAISTSFPFIVLPFGSNSFEVEEDPDKSFSFFVSDEKAVRTVKRDEWRVERGVVGDPREEDAEMGVVAGAEKRR